MDADLIMVSPTEMTKLRTQTKQISFDQVEKEAKFDEYLSYLDNRSQYLKKTGLNSKYSPENTLKQNQFYKRALELQAQKELAHKTKLTKKFNKLFKEDKEKINRLPRYLGTYNYKQELLKNRTEMIRRRIDLEIYRARHDEYGLKRTIKEAVREHKEMEEQKRKNRMHSLTRMRKRMPVQLKKSTGMGQLLTEKILADANVVSFLTEVPDNGSDISKSAMSSEDSEEFEFEYLNDEKN